MPRRKKRWWKPNINKNSLQSSIALVTILLGLLVLVAYIGTAAGVDNFLQQFFFFSFGYASLFLPINLVAIGLSFTKLKHPIAQPRILWGTTLFLLSFTLLLGSFPGTAGGWLGEKAVSALAVYITPFGVLLTALTLITVSLLITFNTSLDNLIEIIQKNKDRLAFIPAMLSKVSNQFSSSHPMKKEEAPAVSSTTESDQPIIQSHRNHDQTEPPSIEIVDEQTSSEPTPPSRPPSTPTPDQATLLPYEPPSIDLLAEPQTITTDRTLIERNAQIIEKTLANFGIQARIAEVNLGPAVTQYAIDLAEGTRTSKITSLQTDLALALASPTGSVRIESPIPGKRLIGIEVPNQNLSIVSLKSILQSPAMTQNKSPLAVALGEDVSGQPVVARIDKWPHILIAGSTGSGKSVLLHALINSILFRARPKEVSFIMIDPKRVELTQYNGIPHLRTDVIVDADKTVNAFKWAVNEMEKRYRLFQQVGARQLSDFNEKTDTEKLPYVIIIVDELADLMAFAANEMETLITRIAQKARATGIFMILSTQRPSVDVITGLIKANIPARIALSVSSGTDSRVIIDQVGAEKLLGRGDLFYLSPDAGAPKRIQGVFMAADEIRKVTQHLAQFGSPYKTNINAHSTTQSIESESPSQPTNELPEIPEDDKFLAAVEVILNHDKASASLLQRRLKIGYARAARILDELEEKQLVGPPDGSNPRDVYVEAARNYLNQINSPQSRTTTEPGPHQTFDL